MKSRQFANLDTKSYTFSFLSYFKMFINGFSFLLSKTNNPSNENSLILNPK